MEAPVTVVVSRRVRPGREEAFRAWARETVDAAARFPGHRGAVLAEPEPPLRDGWVLVFGFDRPEQLVEWDRSPERAERLAAVEPLTAEPATSTVLTGLEGWLAPRTASPVRPPARWRTAVATFVGIAPLALLLNVLAGPRLAALPVVPRSLVVAALLVGLMTWVVMPVVSRALRPFLFPAAEEPA